MKVIPLRCPSCGAKIKAPEAETVVCEYCGTESVVQRRVGVLERPAPIQPRPEMPVATQAHSGAWVLLVLLTPLLLAAGGIGFGAYQQFIQLHWQGTSEIMVADIDGDGDLDLIGPAQRGRGDMFVLALDAKTGETLWSSEELGDHGAAVAGLFAVSRGTALFFHETLGIVAYDGKSGAKRWALSPLSERVRHVCVSEPGTVLLEMADQTFRTLALADGRTKTVAKTECKHATTDDRPFPAEQEAIEPRHATAGMVRAEFAMDVGGQWLVIGHKARGTSVSMLVLSKTLPDSFDLKNPSPIEWEIQIPALEPLQARAEEEHVAVSDTAVFAAYELRDDTNRLTAVELSSGRRLWDVEIERDAPLSSVAYAEGRVFVALWSTLVIFDAKTGKEVDRIGM